MDQENTQNPTSVQNNNSNDPVAEVVPDPYATIQQSSQVLDAGGVTPLEPTVFVPAQNGRFSFLFYLVFGVTLIAFLTVSYLLIQSFLQGKPVSSEQTGQTSQTRPTATPVILVPTVTPLPIDLVVVGLKTLKNATTSADIESDINATDLSGIEDTIKVIDEKLR